MNDFSQELNAVSNVVVATLLFGTARYAYLTVKLGIRKPKEETTAVDQAPASSAPEQTLDPRFEDLPLGLAFWA